MPVMEIPNNIEYPFGDDFKKLWQLWKQYVFEVHQFKYRSVISEQMAIQHIVDLSDGIEDKANKIIQQSIRLEYKGFFPLRQTTSSNGSKSKSTKQSSSTKEQTGGGSTLRERVQAELNKRNGGGQQSGDESYLKAV